jgi:hypothetical protein
MKLLLCKQGVTNIWIHLCSLGKLPYFPVRHKLFTLDKSFHSSRFFLLSSFENKKFPLSAYFSVLFTFFFFWKLKAKKCGKKFNFLNFLSAHFQPCTIITNWGTKKKKKEKKGKLRELKTLRVALWRWKINVKCLIEF